MRTLHIRMGQDGLDGFLPNKNTRYDLRRKSGGWVEWNAISILYI